MQMQMGHYEDAKGKLDRALTIDGPERKMAERSHMASSTLVPNPNPNWRKMAERAHMALENAIEARNEKHSRGENTYDR